MHRLIAIFVVILSVSLSVALAQDPLPAEPITAPVNTDPGLQTLVTIDAEDAFLPSILAILADESGYNIVTGPGVNKEERVSVHLKDTPIEEAMNLVVRAAGLSYEVVGNSFLVASAKKLKEEVGLTSYVIELQYAVATEVQELLEDFNAQIQVDVSGNKLLIITSPKVIAEINKVIEAIDMPSLQIVLEAQLIEVAVEDEEALGIDWGKLSELNMLVSEMGVDQYGTPTLVPEATPYGELPDELNFYPVDGFLGTGYMARQPAVFQVVLDWLIKNNRADVLANSKVATMNNREATIEVIDVIPYVLSAGGVGGQVQVQKEEVGIKLKIKPNVNTDGYITTEITPEVSSVFQLIGPLNNIPWVVKRTSTTTIRVKDGQSIIMAGLIAVNSKTTQHKFPFLGDLPLIGGLFRHRSEDTKKTDLIIKITPRILSTDEPGLEMPKILEEAEKKYMSLASPQEAIGAIYNGCKMYYHDNSEYPTNITELEDEGYLEIDQPTMDQWEFQIVGSTTSIDQIMGTSTEKMKDGAGHVVTYEVDTGKFTGYGLPS
jgi:type II secretory pathway component GspD/PulD (secretin)